MIVFTSGYETAEEAADRPMLNARIGYHTLTREALAADVTASSETGNGPKDAPLRPDTAEYWQPTALPATWVLDWPGLVDVDYVAIAGHNLGTSQVTVKAETSAGPVGSPSEDVWEIVGAIHTPTDDKPIMFLDTVRDATKMRLTFSETGSPATAPQVAVIHVGLSLHMPQAIRGAHSPIALSRQTVLKQALSRGGQFLGQSFRRLGFQGSVSFDLLDADWYRTYFDPFVEEARRYPYFFAWRPGELPEEIAYAWTADDIRPAYMGYMNFMTVQWSMVGLDHE